MLLNKYYNIYNNTLKTKSQYIALVVPKYFYFGILYY